MKFLGSLFVFLLPAVMSVAQPVWSPEVRAQRENKWMQDSLHLSGDKLKKAYGISISYYNQLDKNAGNNKAQNKVMHKKDASMKPLLDKQQYQKYYRREKELRAVLRTKYTGPHQPQ